MSAAQPPTREEMVAFVAGLAAKCEVAAMLGRHYPQAMRLEWQSADDAAADGQALRAIAAALKGGGT